VVILGDNNGGRYGVSFDKTGYTANNEFVRAASVTMTWEALF
jgi:hypothetical protein